MTFDSGGDSTPVEFEQDLVVLNGLAKVVQGSWGSVSADLQVAEQDDAELNDKKMAGREGWREYYRAEQEDQFDRGRNITIKTIGDIPRVQ